ncbi:MAG: sulfatase [Nitrososphaeria archaeon]
MNVIVIMLDTLRYDHLGCYGNTWIKTPHINDFASEAFLFTKAYAEGLPTLPVRTALFTGLYTLPFRGWQRLEPNDITLAEILWDKGVTTALITDTYHMHKPQMAYERGFDQVIFIRGQELDPYKVDENIQVDLSKWHEKNYSSSQYATFAADTGGPHPKFGTEMQRKEYFIQYLKNISNWKSEEDQFVAQVVKAGVKWLEEQVNANNNDRLFLWLDSFDPHEPWNPPREYYDMYAPKEYNGKPIIFGGGNAEEFTNLEIQHIRAQYAGKVTLVDKWVGVFLERIKELGLWENSMIILLSDHGCPIGEHGIIKKVRPWPYEELARIPLIIKYPGIKGKKINSFVETVDIMPTILNAFGVKYKGLVDGESLIPLFKGEKEKIKDFAISGFYERSWSIRDENYTLYLWLDKGKIISRELYETRRNYIPPKPENYDWQKDVAEKNNIVNEKNMIVKELQRILRYRLLSIKKKRVNV